MLLRIQNSNYIVYDHLTSANWKRPLSKKKKNLKIKFNIEEKIFFTIKNSK